MATAFGEFLQAAWADHGEQPQAVADRLASSLHLLDTAAQVPAWAHLVAHVYGEHLGQWQAGVGVLGALQALPLVEGDDAAIGALSRHIAALRLAEGDAAALMLLSTEEQAAAWALASAMFTGRGAWAEALAAYTQALQLAEDGLPAESPALRALAVGGNNLAEALQEKHGRSAAETRGMLIAARAAMRYWKLAGTWLQEERAEYRLARCQLQAGEAQAAVQSAQRCIEVCTRNAAPVLEQFFGHAVLALAQRAAGEYAAFEYSRQQAEKLFEGVAAEERPWCEADLRALRTLPA